MSKTNMFLILTSILAMALLTACAGTPAQNATPSPEPTAESALGANDEPINLRFTIWSSNEAHLAMLNGFAKDYREIHPNVNVQFDTIPVDAYIKRVETQLAGNNPPDAGWAVEKHALAFIEAGVLVDLMPKLEQSPNYDLADLSESALQLWKKDDAIYGIPFSTSPFLILYNRDLFETAGIETPDELLAKDEWTWSALAEAAKSIADANPSGIYGFEGCDADVYGARVWHTLIPIIWAYGGDAWNVEEAQCLLNSAESIAAVQLYHDMVFVDKSAVPPGEWGDFYSGQSAMTIAQLSRVAKLKDAPFEWGVAPLPGGPAGELPVIGQAAIGVFSASKHKETAIDFVTFITNKKNVGGMAEFFPPARISVLESKSFLEANPLLDPESMQQSVAAAIRQGAVLPTHAEFPQIDLAARVQFANLWMPEADVEAVMTDVCESVSPFLGN